MSEVEAEIDVPNEKGERPFSVLDLFKHIASENEKLRTKSHLQLLKFFVLQKNNDTDTKYTLNRLMKGLGAPKQNTKMGFYIALVAFIKSLDISVQDILEAMDKELNPSGKNSKKENADIYCGQILAVGAIVRSGLYDNISTIDKKIIIEKLFDASIKRDYLTLAAYSFLYEIYDKINLKEFNSTIMPIMKSKEIKVNCIDNLMLALTTEEKFPNSSVFDVCKINKKSIPTICNILLSPPRILYKNNPVYTTVPNLISEKDPNDIQLFAAELDAQLRNDSFTYNKFSLSLILLHNVVLNCDVKNIVHVLQRHLITQILNHCNVVRGKPKDALRILINKFLECIGVKLGADKTNQAAKLSVLKKFWFGSGCLDFERITTSKVIQLILAGMDDCSVKELCSLLKDIIENRVNENKILNNNQRIYAAQLFAKLLSHNAVNGNIEWKTKQMEFLSNVTLFKNDSISKELCDSLSEIFYRALDLKMSKLDDLCTILSNLVKYINSKIKDDNTVFRTVPNRVHVELWSETFIKIQSLDKEKKKKKIDKDYIQVFRTLFLQLMLQLFRSESVAETSLRELFVCYGRLTGSKKVDTADDDENIPWIQVVVDLFLNLLSHTSHLLRSIVGCVFPHLCRHLTRDAVHQILAVFDPSNDLETLLGDDDDDDEDDSDLDGESQANGTTKSDSDSDSEGVDDEDEQGTVNDALRDALSVVLRNNTRDSDEESIDIDQMNDDEATNLDMALSNAFKKFRPKMNKSKKQTKEDQTLTHFRVRALDLVEIYVDTNPSMILTLEAMLPLLQCLEFSVKDTHQKPLLDRLRNSLCKLCSLKKFADFEGVTQATLIDLLSSLLDRGTKNAMVVQEISTQIADCCSFILRCSSYLRTNGTKREQTSDSKLKVLILDKLETFIKMRDCMTPYPLFKNILNMASWTAGSLRLAEKLIVFVFDKEVRQFRRHQALELLLIFYSNHRLLSGLSDIDKQTILKIEQTLFEETQQCLQSSDYNKDKFISSLFQLLHAVHHSPVRSNAVDWAVLGETIREYRSGTSFSNDAKAAFNRLCRDIGVSNIVNMKPNQKQLDKSEDPDLPTDGHTQKKRNKSNRDKKTGRKESKEARFLRMQSMSEGLGTFVASMPKLINGNADLSGTMEEDAREIENNVVKKAKRKGLVEEQDAVRKKKSKMQCA